MRSDGNWSPVLHSHVWSTGWNFDEFGSLQYLYQEEREPLQIMALPPTEANLLFHMKRIHVQVTLWKAADRQGPPILDITKFGWDMKSGLPSPSLDTGPVAPDGLIDIISCGCTTSGKACSTGDAAVRDIICHALSTVRVQLAFCVVIP